MSSAPALTSSSFLVCATPATVTNTVTSVFTKTYCVTLPAACPTSSWLATYTVAEVCTGNPADWTTPACPSNFVVSTVACDACQNKQQVITCPNALATDTNIKVLGNNGVTATVHPDLAARPTGPVVPLGGGGAMPAGCPGGPNCPGGGVPGVAAPTGGMGGMGGMPPSPPGTPGNGPLKTYVTAGAPASLKKSILVAGAIALAAGQFLLA
ncbi:hypothetical protein GQ53DRAFT_294369 [Thozetella sp. PMI_491]|nr:hypothetical protein GQ53DRAFT_294369 [Thozetella sp. PMI_491]